MFHCNLNSEDWCRMSANVLTGLCSVRQENRAVNHKHSALEDGLEMLPLPDGKAEEEVTVPVTGQDIKDLDGKLHISACFTAQY